MVDLSGWWHFETQICHTINKIKKGERVEEGRGNVEIPFRKPPRGVAHVCHTPLLKAIFDFLLPPQPLKLAIHGKMARKAQKTIV